MFRLKATDLTDKFGFAEGDLFDDLLEANGYDASACRDGEMDGEEQIFGCAVLVECVRRHLVSVLPPLDIDYNASLSHNPVRLWNRGDGKERSLPETANVVVEVSDDQVLAIAGELERYYSTARQSAANPSA